MPNLTLIDSFWISSSGPLRLSTFKSGYRISSSDVLRTGQKELRYEVGPIFHSFRVSKIVNLQKGSELMFFSMFSKYGGPCIKKEQQLSKWKQLDWLWKGKCKPSLFPRTFPSQLSKGKALWNRVSVSRVTSFKKMTGQVTSSRGRDWGWQHKYVKWRPFWNWKACRGFSLSIRPIMPEQT